MSSWYEPELETLAVLAHQMGTVAAGADPRAHAADPGGRVHTGARGDAVVSGLYVADTSLFPSAIGVNPMPHRDGARSSGGPNGYRRRLSRRGVAGSVGLGGPDFPRA